MSVSKENKKYIYLERYSNWPDNEDHNYGDSKEKKKMREKTLGWRHY